MGLSVPRSAECSGTTSWLRGTTRRRRSTCLPLDFSIHICVGDRRPSSNLCLSSINSASKTSSRQLRNKLSNARRHPVELQQPIPLRNHRVHHQAVVPPIRLGHGARQAFLDVYGQVFWVCSVLPGAEASDQCDGEPRITENKKSAKKRKVSQ